MQSIGPVVLDLEGPELQAEEKELLQHPSVGGIILFSRNYEFPHQIASLCKKIREICPGPILIAVDHEGGRVQRFREGFTVLPSMGKIGSLYNSSPQQALKLAETCGWLMGSELASVNIDLSFAPVLDLDKKINPAIGDRSFHQNPNIVITLAKALIRGMHSAGMAATGKHFPGHGSVKVDSHLGLPVDQRCKEEIFTEDLVPFKDLIEEGIDAIMPAHILFPNIDDKPVGFSKHWLQTILRHQLNFSGVIFSDDLNMRGADVAGLYAERAQTALEAGCDMVLICNNRAAAIEILDRLPKNKFQVSTDKFKKMQKHSQLQSLDQLKSTKEWQEKNNIVMNFSTQEIS